ncbi:MAG: aromatic acid exporter family protein [Lachnospiraceae bacterium]
MRKQIIVKVLKIGLGSSFAILIAETLGVEYASSAGVITLLTLQNTKKGTIKLIVKRIISLCFTLLLLSLGLMLSGQVLLIYGIVLTIMVAVCYQIKWQDTISVNATVLGHSLLLANGLTSTFVKNEFILVSLALTIAFLLNLRMPDASKDILTDIDHVERELKDLLGCIASHLDKSDKLKKDRRHITELITYIDQTFEKAIENKDNTLKEHSQYYIEYLVMRRNQCIVLIHIYRDIGMLEEVPAEFELIAEFLKEMSAKFNVRNSADKRLAELDELTKKLDQISLPESQKELRERTTLYQLVKELEEFLRLKREFLKKVSQEELDIYWK